MRYNIFGEKLQKFRKTKGLTQSQLGKKVGLNQATIALYERGERFPRKETLFKISDFMGSSMESVLDISSKSLEKFSFYDFNIPNFLNILLEDTAEKAISYAKEWKKNNSLNLSQFYSNVLIPTLKETGVKWKRGEIIISEEHLISNKIREIIITLANQESDATTSSSDKKKIWIGLCAPSEKHDLALLMISQLLRAEGWAVYFLGANIPFDDLAKMVQKHNPAVVAISATMYENLDGLELYTRYLYETFGNTIQIIIGGEAAKKCELSPYYTIVDNIEETVRICEKIYKGKKK